ncbi:substrate-binding periplasmic protein [Vogesella mureinivorans]|uniref:substrate-binding periplasmic protein n=1 Tax=Vogesella mureinivorans TaxID=657276 RepID=UPI0011C85B40|nr:transporter substrate-binding domain-containing protein [Vogesella mureinivorans]
MSLRRGVLALMLAAGCATPALGAQPAVLNIAFSVMPPWKTIDANGEAQGPYARILRQLAAQLDATPRFIQCSLSRCLQLMQLGEADVALGLAATPERVAYLDFIPPGLEEDSRIAFFMRSTDHRPLARYEDLAGLRVGVTHDRRYFARFDADTTLQKDVALHTVESMRKLVAGRVDVVIAPVLHGRSVLAAESLAQRVRQMPLQAKSYGGFIALSRLSPWGPYRAQVAMAITRMRAMGQLDPGRQVPHNPRCERANAGARTPGCAYDAAALRP